MNPLIPSVIVAAVLYGVYRVSRVSIRDPRMPKGPPTLPVLGNLHQIPSSGMYRQYVVTHTMAQTMNITAIH